jgi:hypothetical protein
MTDLEALADYAKSRSRDRDCPPGEAWLWRAIAADIGAYLTSEDEPEPLFTEPPERAAP